MLTINEVLEMRTKNPNLTILEVLEILREQYNMDAHEVGVFVRSNKTLYGEIAKECKGFLIDTDKELDLENIF